MNQTENHGLSQWEKTDRILMEDFNADNQKIEQALTEQAEVLTPITEQIGKLGNCQIYSTSYVGTGTKDPITQTFPSKPVVVMVALQSSSNFAIFWNGLTSANSVGTNSYELTLTWSGNSVTWNHTSNAIGNLNSSGSTYHLVALLDMSAG